MALIDDLKRLSVGERLDLVHALWDSIAGADQACPRPAGLPPDDLPGASTDERIDLAMALWDSIAAEDPDLPLSSAQAAELDRRLAEHHRDPGRLLTWDEVKASLLAQP